MSQCNNVLNESKTFIHCIPCVINFRNFFLWQLNIHYFCWLCAIISMKYFRFNKSTIMFLYNIHEHIIFILEKYVSFIIFCVVYVFTKKKTHRRLFTSMLFFKDTRNIFLSMKFYDTSYDKFLELVFRWDHTSVNRCNATTNTIQHCSAINFGVTHHLKTY